MMPGCALKHKRQIIFLCILYSIMYKYLAEFFGTLTFVYIYLATGNPLAIGATLSLVLLFTHSVSKGGLNPAVAIVMSSADHRLPIEMKAEA